MKLTWKSCALIGCGLFVVLVAVLALASALIFREAVEAIPEVMVTVEAQMTSEAGTPPVPESEPSMPERSTPAEVIVGAPSDAPSSPPSGTIAFHVPAGTVGRQAHAGGLGLDFDVLEPIEITHLGAFDSSQDGIVGSIDVFIVERGSAAVYAQVTLTGEDGALVDGSRFVALERPLELPSGFEGSMVAEGYGPKEPNGNAEETVPVWTVNEGAALRFVGSRWSWGPTGGGLPDIRDGGVVNRYAAGSFAFGPVEP